MKQHRVVTALAAFAIAAGANAQDVQASYAVKMMTPETALKAAQAALHACRKQGYQVAVAVVDRAGQAQVMLRDRFAGMHTPNTAIDKAWTAVSFKMSTGAFAEATEAGKEASGIRHLPRVVAIGGGILVEAGGNVFGAIGVSGAPGGAADEMCAKAGVAEVLEELEF